MFFIFSVKLQVSDILFDKLDYKILSNDCVSIQILDTVLIPVFTDKIKPLQNHRLYREDDVFLHPRPKDIIHLNLVLRNLTGRVYNDGALILNYYFGRFIMSPQHLCAGLNCYLQGTSDISEKSHLTVEYPRPFQPMYFKTKTVQYPTGMISFRRFPAFGDYLWMSTGKYSWLSSTIYHINCSKMFNETTGWSKSPINLINEICKPDQLEALKLVPNEAVYNLSLSLPISGIHILEYWTYQCKLKMSATP